MNTLASSSRLFRREKWCREVPRLSGQRSVSNILGQMKQDLKSLRIKFEGPTYFQCLTVSRFRLIRNQMAPPSIGKSKKKWSPKNKTPSYMLAQSSPVSPNSTNQYQHRYPKGRCPVHSISGAIASTQAPTVAHQKPVSRHRRI
jgi:hypothetical protein